MKVEKRESVDCIHMDRDRDRRWAPVTTVINLLVQQNARNVFAI
jgi:hypothetical protein